MVPRLVRPLVSCFSEQTGTSAAFSFHPAVPRCVVFLVIDTFFLVVLLSRSRLRTLRAGFERAAYTLC